MTDDKKEYIIAINIGLTAQNSKEVDKIRGEICRLIASKVNIDSYHSRLIETDDGEPKL